MSSENPLHFVARIVVERVDFVEIEARSGMGMAKTNEMKRIVTELASLTLKSDALYALVEKTNKHLDLVDDIAGRDPVRSKGVRSSDS